MKLRLTAKKQESSDVISFIFEPNSPIKWQAGQFMHYTLPHSNPDDRKEKRWFTISSAPYTNKPAITTRITKVHGSSFKNAIQALNIGDEIEAEEPEGDFVIDDENRNIIYVAGGIGITPLHSILAESDHQNKYLKVHLLYGSRNNDIPFKKEFESYAVKNPDLRIDYIIDPDKINLGKIQEAILNSENPLIYLSGPEPMVESLNDQLLKAGVMEENIKTDYFPGYIDEYSKSSS